VKKKFTVSPKDKDDWISFTQHIGNIDPKEVDILEKNTSIDKIRKLDLHGFSLLSANKLVKKFIIESFNNGCKKILIITGKGSRSTSHDNPYLSEKLSVLKNSIPEYIKNNKDLNCKIFKISKAAINDGGAGALYVFLKKNKKLKNKF